eukprot:1474175-Rhodomonas_salina.2
MCLKRQGYHESGRKTKSMTLHDYNPKSNTRERISGVGRDGVRSGMLRRTQWEVLWRGRAGCAVPTSDADLSRA